jgi:hypothetical protein
MGIAPIGLNGSNGSNAIIEATKLKQQIRDL